MKKTVLLLLVAGSVMALSAQGRGRVDDDRFDNDDRGYRYETDDRYDERGERMEDYLEDAEIVTVTGKLQLENGELAKLVSGGITYTITAPWDELMDLDLKDGMSVTFEGAEIQQAMQWDSKERTLVATAVKMGSKTVEFDHDQDGEGYYGFGTYGAGAKTAGGRGRYNN